MTDEQMTPEEIAWMRSERITEVDEEQCHDPRAADDGRCAYAGPDGTDACGLKCILVVGAVNVKTNPRRRRKCRECGRLMSPHRSAPVCPRCVAERKEAVER